MYSTPNSDFRIVHYVGVNPNRQDNPKVRVKLGITLTVGLGLTLGFI